MKLQWPDKPRSKTCVSGKMLFWRAGGKWGTKYRVCRFVGRKVWYASVAAPLGRFGYDNLSVHRTREAAQRACERHALTTEDKCSS